MAAAIRDFTVTEETVYPKSALQRLLFTEIGLACYRAMAERHILDERQNVDWFFRHFELWCGPHHQVASVRWSESYDEDGIGHHAWEFDVFTEDGVLDVYPVTGWR